MGHGVGETICPAIPRNSPKLEAVHERQIQVQESSPTDLPKVVAQQVCLQFVRLSNEARSRVCSSVTTNCPAMYLRPAMATRDTVLFEEKLNRNLMTISGFFNPAEYETRRSTISTSLTSLAQREASSTWPTISSRQRTSRSSPLDTLRPFHFNFRSPARWTRGRYDCSYSPSPQPLPVR